MMQSKLKKNRINDAKKKFKEIALMMQRKLKNRINDAKKVKKNRIKTQLQLNNQVMLNIYLSKV